MPKITDGMPLDERRAVRKIFVDSTFFGAHANMLSRLGHGAAFSLKRYIDWLYPTPEDREKRVAAMQRHCVLLTITPFISTLLLGFVASMEKEARDNPNFDPEIINRIKTALSGPLSGIGDSLYHVSLRIILASIAIPFALQGSPLGLFIFLGIFELVHHSLRYYLTFASYKGGEKFILKATESDLLPALIKGAGIIGMVVIGWMIASYVSVPLTIGITVGEESAMLVDVINSIMPNLTGLLFSMGIFYLVRKKVNPILLMFGVMALGIVGAAIGIF